MEQESAKGKWARSLNCHQVQYTEILSERDGEGCFTDLMPWTWCCKIGVHQSPVAIKIVLETGIVRGGEEAYPSRTQHCSLGNSFGLEASIGVKSSPTFQEHQSKFSPQNVRLLSSVALYNICPWQLTHKKSDKDSSWGLDLLMFNLRA